MLIDQEGGRVARLRPPHWRKAPPARLLGELYARDPDAGLEATRLNSRLLAADVASVGCDVDCLPVLDIAFPETHAVIGDRAYADRPEPVAALGRAAAEGLLAEGVMPVIKHIPGHGRATVDSHEALPRVTASRAELERTDFVPFKLLSDLPWAMTGHLLFEAIDPEGLHHRFGRGRAGRDPRAISASTGCCCRTISRCRRWAARWASGRRGRWPPAATSPSTATAGWPKWSRSRAGPVR